MNREKIKKITYADNISGYKKVTEQPNHYIADKFHPSAIAWEEIASKFAARLQLLFFKGIIV